MWMVAGVAADHASRRRPVSPHSTSVSSVTPHSTSVNPDYRRTASTSDVRPTSVSSDDYSTPSYVRRRDGEYLIATYLSLYFIKLFNKIIFQLATYTPETFYIWIDQQNKGVTGILMVSVGAGSMGNVCQKTGSYYDYPITLETANKICQHPTLNFHFAGMINKTISYRYYSSFFYRYYHVIRSQSSRIYNVRLVSDQITYTTSSSCYSGDYYTYISCGCDADYFVTSTTCMKCPAGSSSPTNSTICHCPPGQHWFQGHCKECPENTYSLANSTECSNCPNGSYSKPGNTVPIRYDN